jgi:hypothetical protein
VPCIVDRQNICLMNPGLLFEDYLLLPVIFIYQIPRDINLIPIQIFLHCFRQFRTWNPYSEICMGLSKDSR